MTSIVLDPALDFNGLRERFDAQRWRLISSASQPILPGEPEHALFERNAGERAHYTFNPVCKLRVLEFAGQPDASTRSALLIADTETIATWLASPDERTALRGLLAARLAADPRFVGPVDALLNHPRASIADAAARAREDLRATTRGTTRRPVEGEPTSAGTGDPVLVDARGAALAFIDMLKAQVEPVLLALAHDADGSVAASLRPRPEDYSRVFVPDVADAARASYEAIWATPPKVPDARGARLECHVAPAGMLATDNELSRHFPGGYRHVAHLLDPHRVWVRWKYLRPGASAGQSFDGLVWCDDRWSWFPKPFRVLGQIKTS